MSLPVRSAPHRASFALINGAGAGVVEIAPAVTDRKYVVLHYLVVVDGVTTVEWRSGTTPLSGLMPLVANGNASAGGGTGSLAGLFETADGDALNLSVSGAVDVDGHVTFILA